MKVDDLTGVELDYWVAKADGLKVKISNREVFKQGMWKGKTISTRLYVNPRFIMSLIQRDRISYEQFYDTNGFVVCIQEHEAVSSNALTAIKRCIVKRKYGEEVPNE